VQCLPRRSPGNLGLDGLGQKLPCTTAQYFNKRIRKCTWLGELNDIILGRGVYFPLSDALAAPKRPLSRKFLVDKLLTVTLMPQTIGDLCVQFFNEC
jgi:hypothetical protein